MHHADAGRESLGRRSKRDDAAGDLEHARVRGVDTSDDLSERALPRAVLATQRVAAAPGDLDGDVVQRDDAGEALDDVREADRGVDMKVGAIGWSAALPY